MVKEITVLRSPEAASMTLSTTSSNDSKESTSPVSAGKDSSPAKKRTAPTTESNGPTKVTKRRAARACVSCRQRKVRCDVVEGAPCGNCRWDKVQCVVQENRRRKKNLFDSSSSVPHNITAPHGAEAHLIAKPTTTPVHIVSAPGPIRRPSEVSQTSTIGCDPSEQGPWVPGIERSHIPHPLYQQRLQEPDPALLSALQNSNNGSRFASIWPNPNARQNQNANFATESLRAAPFWRNVKQPEEPPQLPPFIQPLPNKIAAEDVEFLRTKGALSLPDVRLQDACLRGYIEYVHPYMPALDLNELLTAINARDGHRGCVSLFLFQAIMFAATAFVDIEILKEAGFCSRKEARKTFFHRVRLLYDFDYESDRLLLVQGLLMMTYWYETPDDQKDTWHWMGVAISLAHTIGLHRNPADSSMPLHRQKLFKRLWWSCFMRDRLIALGMRRPTRIKDEDYNVPMLEEGDFVFEPLSDEVTIVGPECPLVRDIAMQKELALMCIAKARLCLCISHMLRAQYSMLIRDKMRSDMTANSKGMLLPNKKLPAARTDRSLRTM